ncbi:MAG TPA: carboxypeptidase-like regulatory domain-containing protein [Gemmatimonadaceae bacterium]
MTGTTTQLLHVSSIDRGARQIRRIGWLAIAMLAFAGHAGAQTHNDTIRGTVTTDSGKAISDADIIVTMAPMRDSRATKTDSSGRYTMVFARGTGDYLVHISAVGYETFRKRVTRTGTDSVFTVDAKLARAGVQKLAAVNVTAEKKKPDREEFSFGTEVGASEQIAGGVAGAVSPDQEGNLAAIGATIPGVATTPGGLSVGGLGSDQNSTTLNGLAFGGADIPRAAQTNVRVSSSTYDPSRGWFGGLNENVELSQGNIFAARRADLTIDAPALQYTDPVSARMGQRFSNVSADFGGDGSMMADKYVYSYGMHAGRRASDAVSLSDAAPDLLQRAGVSSDSAARLFNILSTAGVPIRPKGTPSSQITQNLSFIGRFDHAPYNWTDFTPAKTTWGVLAYGRISADNSRGITPTSTAANGGSSSQAQGTLQALYSTYLHGDYLNEERSSVSYSRDKTDPFLVLPGGSVLVGSSFPDGTGGLTSLDFGGNSSMLSDTRKWTWETTSETQFYAHGRSAHRVKLNADSRFDGVSQNVSSNSLGSFTFKSLGDLAANQPSSFSRSLNAPTLNGSVWNGFAAIGDLWRVSPTFQILYGGRFEGNRYTSAPAFNPEVQSVFGLRTDNAPNTIHFSPRIGFTWMRRQGGDGIMFSPIGQFRFGAPSYVRGGVGEFRNILPANLLSNASIATGLPGGLRTVSCVGAATPIPDWSQYLSDPEQIPTQCVGGQTPAFSDAAPSVQLFDPGYTAPRTWRANLGYSSQFRKYLTYSIEGLYSLNLNQPGRVDVNFNNVSRFTLADEGRPVFVNRGSIVNSSGSLSAVDARISPSFGHVIDNISALTSRSRQITLSASPNLDRISSWYAAFDYTLADTRARESGFDGSTFGSPIARDWARGNLDVRHQLLLQGGYSRKKFALTFFGRLQSGLPFTPMVGGDVNGDGLANDRAFIFNPATTSDASLAAATRSLLSSASQNVRSCLTRQLDQAAGRNSCEGPWTTALNAQLSFSGLLPVTGKYGRISLALSNPLGGLDQLLHGADRLRGWGTAAYPDPVLYIPTGFDPATARFKYAVNPRFGDTRPTNTLLRAPFRVTLDISLTLGRSLDQQQLDRWIMPGRQGRKGPKLSVKELVRRYSRNVPDPYSMILEQSDSLLLTPGQSAALEKADTAYRARIDTLWKSLSEYLYALPDDFKPADALKRQGDDVQAAWDLTKADLEKSLPAILSPIQMKLLPWMPALLIKEKGKVRLRMFAG